MDERRDDVSGKVKKNLHESGFNEPFGLVYAEGGETKKGTSLGRHRQYDLGDEFAFKDIKGSRRAG